MTSKKPIFFLAFLYIGKYLTKVSVKYFLILKMIVNIDIFMFEKRKNIYDKGWV